jgi:tellurite resistance protein
LVTASKRFIASAAGQGTVNGCYTVARADGNAQTVKLQGVSGDTNTFTVAQATFEVDIIHTLK